MVKHKHKQNYVFVSPKYEEVARFARSSDYDDCCRKRSQPVRGDLLPDPDKLLSYKHHDKKNDEELEDPTVPGGQPKPPPEPRQPGQGAERKRSTVTFCPVIHTIDK